MEETLQKIKAEVESPQMQSLYALACTNLERPFTQEEAKEMAIVLMNIYQYTHTE